MNTSRRYQCALITGASSGLGVEYARQLVGRCDTLLLVARREEALNDIASQLQQSAPSTTIHVIPTDLTLASDREMLFEILRAMKLVPDLLVNNAGMGDYGAFKSAKWEKLDSMLSVNIDALTHLCHGLLPGMIQQNRGAIINASSLASLLPIPDFAVYAATKAYVTSFSEALRMELLGYDIPVTAVCPGPVHTGFGKIAMRDGEADSLPSREGFYTSQECVVSESIQALEHNKARVFPGWKITLIAAGVSVIPMAALRMILCKRRG